MKYLLFHEQHSVDAPSILEVGSHLSYNKLYVPRHIAFMLTCCADSRSRTRNFDSKVYSIWEALQFRKFLHRVLWSWLRKPLPGIWACHIPSLFRSISRAHCCTWSLFGRLSRFTESAVPETGTSWGLPTVMPGTAMRRVAWGMPYRVPWFLTVLCSRVIWIYFWRPLAPGLWIGVIVNCTRFPSLVEFRHSASIHFALFISIEVCLLPFQFLQP